MAEKQEDIIIEQQKNAKDDITVKKRYRKGKMLGKGGFAKCFEVTNLESDKILAAKIIPKETLTKSRAKVKLISEIKIHKSLLHQHVVKFEHVFEDRENVYILLELCTNQTLNELIKRRKRLIDLEVQCYINQILRALFYLHDHRVIHRDLKLGNLFINEKMELKLGDFGLATKLEFEGEKKRTICGTPNYIAPEILEGKSGHSYEVDVWSLGVIIYTLLIGKPPFETPDVKQTYKRIKQNSYSFPDKVPIADPARALIQKIFNLDPSKRPTLKEIQDHTYFKTSASIPRTLPKCCLNNPPNAAFIKQHIPPGSYNSQIQSQPMKLAESSSLINKNASTYGTKNQLMQSKDKLDNKKYNATTNNWSQSKIGQRPQTQQRNTNSSKQISQNMQQGYNTQNFSSKQFPAGNKMMPLPSSNDNDKQEVYVKSWVDYSSKYGLGYKLSNKTSGVYFNDSSKIILDPQEQYFEYLEKRTGDKQDSYHKYSISQYPEELQKKVTLLHHFKNYLNPDKKQTSQSRSRLDSSKQNLSKSIDKNTEHLVYIKKWMKTKHAVMFRLSNKLVQVNFTDYTEILLSSNNKQVTYVNKKGERNNYPLQSALESSNQEMSKRLKYTKEILQHMLQQTNDRNMQQQQQQQQISQQTQNLLQSQQYQNQQPQPVNQDQNE